jgi:hypothetical protein
MEHQWLGISALCAMLQKSWMSGQTKDTYLPKLARQ